MPSPLPLSPVLLPVLVAGLGAVAAGLAVAAWRRTRRAFLALGRDRRALIAEVERLEALASERSKAEAATEAKSRFLATVTHEIRTPLSGMLGMADLLLGTALSREQQSYVGAIRSSGAALALLVDEILDLSRIEAGRLDLLPEPFALVELVERTAELLAPRAHNRDLDLTVLIEPGTPLTVEGDKLRLGQVLTNLLSNAIKFTPGGGIELRLTPEPDGTVVFRVSDTGIGVPLDRQVAIFDAYEQAVNGLDQSDEGTGLGLAIAREIVRAMGGTLAVADRPGGGSVFSFAIHLPGLDPPVAHRKHPPEHRGAGLVVSPAPFLPLALARFLEANSVAAHRATSLDTAAAALMTEGPFAVVLIDCSLGQAEVTAIIDRARNRGAVRILLVFSPLERRRFGQALAAKADGWLVKPVRRSSLLERLRPPVVPRVPLPKPGPSRVPALAVMVADDDDVNALVTRVSLAKVGAAIVRASDGVEALAAVRQARGEGRPYDLVLLDLHMPGLTGFEVARALRQDEGRDGTLPQRIVAATASVDDTTRRLCREAGFDGVVAKPVTAEVLRFTDCSPLTAASA